MGRKIRVGVVFGGRSAEHEVSLQSARSILDAMDAQKYEIVLLGIDRAGRWYLNDDSRPLLESGSRPVSEPGGMPKPITGGAMEVAIAPRGNGSEIMDLRANRGMGSLDVLFPVLHGPYGEDGSVQGLCRLANLPCVGAGVLGSAVGMDKDVMKRLLRDAGIPTARFLTVESHAARETSFEKASAELGLPLFVKPANLGSSVGVSKARDAREFTDAMELAFRYDTKVLVEECIRGREVECSVLGNTRPEASLPGEILPSRDFYDYEAKYIDENGAVLQIPARLEESTIAEVRRLAVQAFTVLCCHGMARVDMFVEPEGRVLVNEINTIPGFTRISMYPKLWEATGISFSELVDRLIALAIERFQAEQGLATAPPS
jgi:D-alanine-D-alanine ligase